MAIFDYLGFTWDSADIPVVINPKSIQRTTFRLQQSLAEYVWDASMLEDNPLSFQEVQSVLDGVAISDQKTSDIAQVRNLALSTKRLLAMVRNDEFSLTKPVSDEIHSLVAQGEALEWGHFRGEGEETSFTPKVALGQYDPHTPIATTPGARKLKVLFDQGTKALQAEIDNPLERGMAHFLFGALQQFYFDGNKRTSRMMMNGILMSNGIDAISIPAKRALEFNTKMVDFYRTKDATEMMDFLVDCYPEPSNIPRSNDQSNDHGMEP